MSSAAVKRVVDRVARLLTGSVRTPRCSSCGDPVELVLDNPKGAVVVSVAHPVPVCPEFARALEDE